MRRTIPETGELAFGTRAFARVFNRCRCVAHALTAFLAAWSASGCGR